MIEVRALGKVFQAETRQVWAIGDVSFSVGKGEFVSIVGPSGCGKSTILNIVASFLAPTVGEVRVNGDLVHEGTIPKGLGYLFQKDTVLPWYTVRKNISLGPWYRGASSDTVDRKVSSLLSMVGLQGCEEMYPHHLSGGMRQRVALLMTLACDPTILLLDEPFGALDTHTKVLLHKQLLEIWERLGQTIILVTHDLAEAITLSERVLVLSAPPSRVIFDHRVDISHPRDVFSIRESPVFTEHFQRVWHVLGEEFRHTDIAVSAGEGARPHGEKRSDDPR